MRKLVAACVAVCAILCVAGCGPKEDEADIALRNKPKGNKPTELQQTQQQPRAEPLTQAGKVNQAN